VPSDVPGPATTTTSVAVSTDYDTDNTYKLSPERLVWNIQKLGLLGEIDHYCGVFWWKQSVAQNPSYPTCTVTFSDNWNDQDVVWLHIGGSAIGKTVFGGQDNSNTIARHFANFINAIFDGVWASASGSVLTITSHSFSAVWQFHAYTQLPASNTGSGQATVTGDLEGGTYGATWVIDPTQTSVLNRAFRDWNTDFFALLKANSMTAVCSFSQELVNPHCRHPRGDQRSIRDRESPIRGLRLAQGLLPGLRVADYPRCAVPRGMGPVSTGPRSQFSNCGGGERLRH
jgi:hypothetical protein